MRFETRNIRISSNITAKPLKRSFVADEMIKTLILPKTTAALQNLINLECRPFFPGFDLFEHGTPLKPSDEEMHVIGHDYIVAQHIPDPVKMMQGIRYLPTDSWITQHTFTMAPVERLFQ